MDSIKIMTENFVKSGKVRDIYSFNDDLIMVHTDRLSANNKHVVNVPGKGHILALISKYWFDRTRSIIDNHVIHYSDNYLVCKKCRSNSN